MSAVHTPMPSDLLVQGWQDPGAVCGHAAPEASPGAAPEVADIFRAYGEAYRATHRLSGQQLRAFSRHVLHDVRVRQVQLDELFALLSAVQDGEVSEAEAIERLERSPQWISVAMDPESKLVLALDVGNRT